MLSAQPLGKPAHPEADEIVAAHVAMRKALIPNERMWRYHGPGLTASSTGIECPTCNTIYVHGSDADPEQVSAIIRQFTGNKLPFHLTIRSSILASYEGTAATHELSRLADLPLMVLKPENYRPVQTPEELKVRLLPRTAKPIHLDLVAEGLGMSREGIGFLMSPDHMAAAGWSTYVGEVAGDLAVTGSAISNEEYVGLISIVTDTAFRRRGYGSALVSSAISDAFAHGARRIFLHSSDQGYGVYESLGFETVEHLCIFGQAGETVLGH